MAGRRYGSIELLTAGECRYLLVAHPGWAQRVDVAFALLEHTVSGAPGFLYRVAEAAQAGFRMS